MRNFIIAFAVQNKIQKKGKKGTMECARQCVTLRKVLRDFIAQLNVATADVR